MPYIAPEVVQEVKKMDLLTYLRNYEPYELLHFFGNTYTIKTHDSLKIFNGKWMWWSRGIGGRIALDYLIKVKGYSFIEAVEITAGQVAIGPPVSLPIEKPKEKKLLLTKANLDQGRFQQHLFGFLRSIRRLKTWSFIWTMTRLESLRQKLYRWCFRSSITPEINRRNAAKTTTILYVFV